MRVQSQNYPVPTEYRLPQSLTLSEDPVVLDITSLLEKKQKVREWYETEISYLQGLQEPERSRMFGAETTIAICGGPQNWKAYCADLTEAARTGVLPSVFLKEYSQTLTKGLQDAMQKKASYYFMKQQRNITEFLQGINGAETPEETAYFLFSRHWELSVAEMGSYWLNDMRRQFNSIGRILNRIDGEIAELEERGL